MPELPAKNILQPQPHQINVHFQASQLSAGLIASHLLTLLPVNDLRIEEPQIESIIRQLYEGTLQLGDV